MSLVIQNKANADSLCRFLEQNVCSRQKRKRHYEFLRYLKQSFQALHKYKKKQGLKIQIKGRFAHKAKGRSRVWKYQIGQMPLTPSPPPHCACTCHATLPPTDPGPRNELLEKYLTRKSVLGAVQLVLALVGMALIIIIPLTFICREALGVALVRVRSRVIGHSYHAFRSS